MQPCTPTFMVTFPFVIFLILKPTVGIISSVNCPDWNAKKNYTYYKITDTKQLNFSFAK